MKNLKYLLLNDTASTAPFIVDLRNYIHFSFRELDHDTIDYDECGSHFASNINKGLKELEDWNSLPKFDTIEELLEELNR